MHCQGGEWELAPKLPSSEEEPKPPLKEASGKFWGLAPTSCPDSAHSPGAPAHTVPGRTREAWEQGLESSGGGAAGLPALHSQRRGDS